MVTPSGAIYAFVVTQSGAIDAFVVTQSGAIYAFVVTQCGAIYAFSVKTSMRILTLFNSFETEGKLKFDFNLCLYE